MRSVSLQYNVYPAEVSGERLLLLVSQKVFVQHTGLDSGIVLVFAGLVFLIVAQDGVVIDLADLYVGVDDDGAVTWMNRPKRPTEERPSSMGTNRSVLVYSTVRPR